MTQDVVYIGNRLVGKGHPTYIVAEIGINHNGDLDTAKQLIDVAVATGCDAVKFQKRTPELAVPQDEWDKPRETPWGTMRYIDYKAMIEFGEDEYEEIDTYCRELGIDWFASCWDVPSVEFMRQFDPPAYKLASASLTDSNLIRAITDVMITDRFMNHSQPVLIASTGMSTPTEVQAAVSWFEPVPFLLCHTTSTYPCPVEELNLSVISRFRNCFDCPIGYSGHELSLHTTVAAVALGASLVERHITLDSKMWGSDQSASLEPDELGELVRQIRKLEVAMGDGRKRVFPSELSARKKLRGA